MSSLPPPLQQNLLSVILVFPLLPAMFKSVTSPDDINYETQFIIVFLFLHPVSFFFCFIFFWLGDLADLLTKFLFLRKRVWMFKYFIRTYFFWQQGSPDIERPRHLVDLRWIWLLIGLRMQYISTMNNIKVNSFLWMK